MILDSSFIRFRKRKARSRMAFLGCLQFRGYRMILFMFHIDFRIQFHFFWRQAAEHLRFAMRNLIIGYAVFQ